MVTLTVFLQAKKSSPIHSAENILTCCHSGRQFSVLHNNSRGRSLWGRVKGICYGNDAFPAPYNPSIANSTQVFFGSDNTADYIGSLFRSNYANSVKPWCQSMGPGESNCRTDLPKMLNMGVEVIRLYDWDPRNAHQLFLDWLP